MRKARSIVMTQRQIGALVDDLLVTAAESALRGDTWSAAHGQGLYHAAERLAAVVDWEVRVTWPFYSEWRDMLVAAVRS